MFKMPFKAAGPIIGITGSIGSGKTEVSNYLNSLNYSVINFDEVSREIREQPEVKAKLLKEFKTTDPKEIRKLIGNNFMKSMVLSRLVAIPALMETFKRTNDLFKQGAPLVFWEAALLIETKTAQSLPGIILVTADESSRITRVIQRDQVDEASVKSLISQQLPDSEKIKLIKSHPHHLVLENNGSLADFQLKLLQIEPWLLNFKKS